MTGPTTKVSAICTTARTIGFCRIDLKNLPMLLKKSDSQEWPVGSVKVSGLLPT
jgi:hypothetical protein